MQEKRLSWGKDSNMKRIACLGDSCVDRYDTGEVFPGGNPVNVAVYINRLGGAASFIGAVGSDAYAELLLTPLAQKGIDVSHVQRLSGSTPISYVEIQNGNRVFVDYDTGVMTDYVPSDDDITFACAHDLVVSDIWGHAEPALERIHAAGVPVAYDCADLPVDPVSLSALPFVDIAFFSDDAVDEQGIREEILRVASYGPKIVIAMRGASGSIAYDGTDFYPCAAVQCEVVDTLGAGDSFIAGFLFEYVRHAPILHCMRTGARNASITIGYRGAW